MSSLPTWASKRLRRQRGVATVEVALLSIIFFALVFAVIEMARLMYVLNTLQEASRSAAQAAAVTDFRDAPALDRLRQRAVFRDSPGPLLLGAPVSDAALRIDYLAAVRAPSGELELLEIPPASLPAGPARNRAVCMANPHSPACVRFVRVRICDPAYGGECHSLRFGLRIPMVRISAALPTATTIRVAESLGFVPGQSPLP